jgi:hypothetical protein
LDGYAQDRSKLFPVERWEIRPATCKAYAIGCLRNNHYSIAISKDLS